MKRNSNIHISGKTKNLYWLVNGAMLIAIMGVYFPYCCLYRLGGVDRKHC